VIRLLSVPALLLLACALSGVYGMVHNQVSYSISSEYFTKFKFDQFDISQSVSERLGAAIVGWHASWWMGAFIGLFLVPAGMLVRAFSVVLATTILVGMIGLLLAIAFTKADPVVDTMLRDALIDDPVAFRRTAALHNASYIGGLLGIFAGLVSVFKAFLQENDRLNFRPREVEE